METVLAAEHLTKVYGTARGIDDVTLEVKRGEVFGFLGPNGAGKTTTIRLLLDLIRPTSGHMTVFGLDARAQATEIHRRVGYLPGGLRLYERMTGGELLAYFSALRGADRPVDLSALIERLNVEVDRPIRTLSRGNRQKIGLVQALMHQPELVILDEPTSGLDPLIQEEVGAILRETAADASSWPLRARTRSAPTSRGTEGLILGCRDKRAGRTFLADADSGGDSGGAGQLGRRSR